MLELTLFRNQHQLGTREILYSDGIRYAPATEAIRHLKPYLGDMKQVLVLGTGLGSVVQVLHKHGAKPHFTLVETDKTTLGWAIELLDDVHSANITPVCSDAAIYMKKAKLHFDFIFIDIFIGRTVPSFATSPEFLQQCKNRLTPNGHLAFNYIINSNDDWEAFRKCFGAIFPKHHIISHSVNRIIVV